MIITREGKQHSLEGLVAQLVRSKDDVAKSVIPKARYEISSEVLLGGILEFVHVDTYIVDGDLADELHPLVQSSFRVVEHEFNPVQ